MSRKYAVETVLFSGQGAVMLAERDPSDGHPMGLIPIGDVNNGAQLAIDITFRDILETHSGQRGLLKRKKTQTAASLTVNTLSIDVEALRLGLYGSHTAIAASTATDIPVKAYLGKTILTGYMHISSVVVTDSTGVTTYVEDTDYSVNAEWGSINILSGGSIANAQDLLIDVAFADHDDIQALTQDTPERWLRIEGINTEDNKPWSVDLFRASVDGFTDLEVIGENEAAPQRVFTALADPFRSAPQSVYAQYKGGSVAIA